MGFFVSILFCLLVVTCLGQSNNKHMICKSVDDVFDDVGSTDVSRRRHIGPPGKPGLPGKGLPGPKGSDGEVDYERLKEIVRARVDEETREMEIKFNKINEQLQNVTDKVNNAQSQIRAMCDGVIHNGKCIWAEVHSSEDTNIAGAQEICRKRGSRLAVLYSKDQFDFMMEYLRSKLYGRPWIRIWTGMRKIYGNRHARLPDNTKAPYTKARTYSPEWNSASREHTHVYLVAREPNYFGSDQGMGAFVPTWYAHGALCQLQ